MARSTCRRVSAPSGWLTRTALSPSVAAEEESRVDHVRSYGAGMGYRMGEDLRIAFTLDNYRRVSEVDDRRVRRPPVRRLNYLRPIAD